MIDLGADQCSPCHGDDPEKASGGGCGTCHALYPLHQVADVWQGILGHGKYVREKGNTNECRTHCHGADLSGGYDPAGKKACAKCHASYPLAHAGASWPQAGHGQFVRSAGNSTECGTMCHRADVPAAMKLKACSECHRSYPEPHAGAQWKGAGHPQFLSAYGGVAQTDCTLCHGQHLEGKGKAVACVSCHHTGGAGAAAWSAAGEHGLAATNDLSKCLPCHGSDLKGNAVIAGCDGCHHESWGLLHGGVAWLDATQHGALGMPPAASCRVCHGADLSGGASGKGCSGCHEGLYPHGENYEEPAQHGPAAIAQAFACASCHEPSEHFCKTCHHDTIPGWLNLGHGGVTLDQVNGCKTCHGLNLEGSPFASGCVACHGPGMSHHQGLIVNEMCCVEADMDVNPEDPDAGCVNWQPCFWNVDFLAAGVHGAQAQANLDKCRICHGLDKKGGFSGKSCYACHDPGNKHPHDPAALPLWQAVVAAAGDPAGPKTAIAGRPLMLMVTNCWTPCHVVAGMPGGIYGLVDLWQGCFACHTW